MALGFAALSLAGHDRQIKDIETGLAAELAWQVLPDGGHVTRNPALLVEVLLDLLPLSQCFTARDRALPDQLSDAIQSMLAAHAAGRVDHNYRLWMIFNLEVFWRHFIDRDPVTRVEEWVARARA
jgi:uncharacterized heparinase superfamily protein